MTVVQNIHSSPRPHPRVILELLKPITWFAPVWAFGCGVVSSGQPIGENLAIVIAGAILAGPMVCGASQAVNDWYDRHVDAINEPDRPIPSGRMPGRWGLWIAILWFGLSMALGLALGPWAGVATVVGLFLAWAYSAPPFRFKQDGWLGAAAVGGAYEGIPWFTGAAILAGSFPDVRIVTLAVLYSIGAHGIMTLNDFKAVEGDRAMGIRSLPVRMGVRPAALTASVFMAVPQVAVIALLISWDRAWHGAAVAGLLAVQIGLMGWMMRDPRGRAPAFNASGTLLFVIGMLTSAFALRTLVGGA